MFHFGGLVWIFYISAMLPVSHFFIKGLYMNNAEIWVEAFKCILFLTVWQTMSLKIDWKGMKTVKVTAGG